MQASENGTALLLRGIKKQLSFRGTSDFDVILNSKTTISVTEVPFAFRKPQQQPKKKPGRSCCNGGRQ
ncbi:hypothetical protein NFI96_028654, partial [Prochilodus magdalenae]